LRTRPAAHDPVAAAAAPARPFADRQVIVVDDDAAIVTAMRALFEVWGARVAGGEDVAAALAAHAAASRRAVRRADLIVADLRLAGGVSGIDAVAQLRAHLGTPIPALIVSGDTAPAARDEAAAAGITLLAKPLVADELMAAARRSMSVGPS
jgi:hypothetical protein